MGYHNETKWYGDLGMKILIGISTAAMLFSVFLLGFVMLDGLFGLNIVKKGPYPIVDKSQCGVLHGK